MKKICATIIAALICVAGIAGGKADTDSLVREYVKIKNKTFEAGGSVSELEFCEGKVLKVKGYDPYADKGVSEKSRQELMIKALTIDVSMSEVRKLVEDFDYKCNIVFYNNCELSGEPIREVVIDKSSFPKVKFDKKVLVSKTKEFVKALKQMDRTSLSEICTKRFLSIIEVAGKEEVMKIFGFENAGTDRQRQLPSLNEPFIEMLEDGARVDFYQNGKVCRVFWVLEDNELKVYKMKFSDVVRWNLEREEDNLTEEQYLRYSLLEAYRELNRVQEESMDEEVRFFRLVTPTEKND